MPEQEIFTEDFEEKEKVRPKKEKDDIVNPESPVLDNTEPDAPQTGFFSRIRDWVKQTFEKVKETLKDRLPSLNKPGGFLDRVETRIFGGKEAYNKLYIPDNAVVTQKENRISELTKEEPKSKEEKREERDKLQASKQFERYKTLAEKGDIESCLRLGDCYHRGTVKMGDKTVSIDGLSQDPKLEFDYYKKAFELSGGKEGAILLGRCYEHGFGTEVNLSKAKELYAPYDSELKQFEARYPDLQKQNSAIVNPDIFNDSSDVDLLKNDNQANILENTKNLRTIDVFESSVSGRLLTDTEGKEYLYVSRDNENVTVIPIETDENGNSFANPENKLNLPSDQIVGIGQTKNISLESAKKEKNFIADEIRKEEKEEREEKKEQEEIEEAEEAADAVEEVFDDVEDAEKIEEELSEEIADSEEGFVPPEYEDVIEETEDAGENIAGNEDIDVVENATDSQSEVPEFEIDKDGLLVKYNGPGGDVVVPEGVTSVVNLSLCNDEKITSITLPDSVTKIGNGAFYRYTDLKSINIPDSVTSIGDNAFKDCTSLTSVTIGNSVTTIGEGAFNNCYSLTSVTIPDSVTSIGDFAFYNCTNLTSVAIPDGVTSIGEGAFFLCQSIKSITIPESVTSIGDSAFFGCTFKDAYYTGTKEQWAELMKNSPDCDIDTENIKVNFVNEKVIENSDEQKSTNNKPIAEEIPKSEIEKGDILKSSNGNHYLYTGALKKEPDKCWLQKVEYNDSQKVWKTTGERSFKEKVDKLDDYKIERKAFGDFQKGDDAYDYEGNHGTISRIKNNIITFEYDNGTKLDCFATELQKADNAAISVEEKNEIPEESKHIKETFVTEEKQENDFFTADTQDDPFSLEDVRADEYEDYDEFEPKLDDAAIEEIEDF